MTPQVKFLGIYHRDIPAVYQNKLKSFALREQHDDLERERREQKTILEKERMWHFVSRERQWQMFITETYSYLKAWSDTATTGQTIYHSQFSQSTSQM